MITTDIVLTLTLSHILHRPFRVRVAHHIHQSPALGLAQGLQAFQAIEATVSVPAMLPTTLTYLMSVLMGPCTMRIFLVDIQDIMTHAAVIVVNMTWSISVQGSHTRLQPNERILERKSFRL